MNQEAISEIYDYTGLMRAAARGGCCGGPDWLDYKPAVSTCEAWCTWASGNGGTNVMHVTGGGSTVLPYYSKCFPSATSPPINAKRFAFVSQLGTINIDPALPKTNLSNLNDCCINFPSFSHLFSGGLFL